VNRPLLSGVLTIRVSRAELAKLRHVVARARQLAKLDGFPKPGRAEVIRDVLKLGTECALARQEVRS
jgi:hypothetical protein